MDASKAASFTCVSSDTATEKEIRDLAKDFDIVFVMVEPGTHPSDVLQKFTSLIQELAPRVVVTREFKTIDVSMTIEEPAEEPKSDEQSEPTIEDPAEEDDSAEEVE